MWIRSLVAGNARDLAPFEHRSKNVCPITRWKRSVFAGENMLTIDTYSSNGASAIVVQQVVQLKVYEKVWEPSWSETVAPRYNGTGVASFLGE